MKGFWRLVESGGTGRANQVVYLYIHVHASRWRKFLPLEKITCLAGRLVSCLRCFVWSWGDCVLERDLNEALQCAKSSI